MSVATRGRRDWKWKIELRAATYPQEEWMLVRRPTGRWCLFVEEDEARAALADLRRIQPHAPFRLAKV